MDVSTGDDFTVDLPPIASSSQHSQHVEKAGTKGTEGSVRRASHKKHRTGCQTCKRRHVKCDEGMPHCQRCIGSNHECEGYVTPAPIVRWRGASFRGFQIVNVNPTKTRPQKAPAPSEEKFALQFFRERTAKYWVSYFPDGPWSVPLLAAQESHEVLRRCCVAVGSLHAAMSYDAKAITPDTSNQVDNTSRRNFSLKQYTRALGLLREEIDSKNVNSQVVLLACIMLFIYECLQGRRQNLEVHLRHGLQLTKIQKKDHQHSDLVSAILIRLRRLYLLYGRPRPQVTPDTARLLMYSLAQPFQEPVDLNILRECIGDLGPSVQLFRSCVINQMFPTSEIQEEGRILINKRMNVCLSALDKLEAKDQEDGSRYRLAFSWLRMVAGLSWVFLQVAHTDDYTSFDAYHATFQLIIDTTSELLQDLNLEADPTSLIFSIDLGFIPTLFLTAISCRHPKMRRKAVELLRKVPKMEGLWAAEVTAQAAEKVIEFEESHIPPECLEHVEDASHGYGIPAQWRAYDVDIRDDLPPKGPLGKLISLRLSPCPPNEGDPSLEHHI